VQYKPVSCKRISNRNKKGDKQIAFVSKTRTFGALECEIRALCSPKTTRKFVIDRVQTVQFRVRNFELIEGAKVPRCHGTLILYPLAPWHLGGRFGEKCLNRCRVNSSE